MVVVWEMVCADDGVALEWSAVGCNLRNGVESYESVPSPRGQSGKLFSGWSLCMD